MTEDILTVRVDKVVYIRKGTQMSAMTDSYSLNATVESYNGQFSNLFDGYVKDSNGVVVSAFRCDGNGTLNTDFITSTNRTAILETVEAFIGGIKARIAAGDDSTDMEGGNA